MLSVWGVSTTSVALVEPVSATLPRNHISLTSIGKSVLTVNSDRYSENRVRKWLEGLFVLPGKIVQAGVGVVVVLCGVLQHVLLG